jgi:hypothetical protein
MGSRSRYSRKGVPKRDRGGKDDLKVKWVKKDSVHKRKAKRKAARKARRKNRGKR